MNQIYSLEFKQRVVDLRYKDGLSAVQVAQKLSVEYKRLFGKEMTKNIVIGLWNRNKHLINHEHNDTTNAESRITKSEIKRVSIAKEMERYKSLRDSNKDKYRVRKCLSCLKEKILEKRMYICNPCKETQNYKDGMVWHTNTSGIAV